MKHNIHKKSGFTLIEVSIVLVIVGLVIGGVLVGKDLIDSAKIRQQVRQLDTFKLAVSSFKLKYNCLPGDCASATAFGLGSNGNGNEVIEQNAANLASNCSLWTTNISTPDCDFDGEFPLFFQHLSASKMIAETYDGSTVLGQGYPKLALNESKGMVVAGSWKSESADTTPDYISRDYNFPNAFWMHMKWCDTSQSAPAWGDESCGELTPTQTRQIDIKIDDGKPLSGTFFGYTGSPNGWTPNLCLNGSNTDYNISDYVVCHAAYRLY